MNKVKSKKKSPVFNWKVIVVMVLVVATLVGGLYYWNESRKPDTPETVATKDQEESARVISSLSLVLFTDSKEQPTVARIEVPEALKKTDEDFYKNAQVGDYLVLYPNRVVIYRESENLVVNVAQIVNTSDIVPNN